jgi:1-deoxy-D-xylulose-5-phosphate synthase
MSKATHCGAVDIAYLRCIPNLAVLTPADEAECRPALTPPFKAGQPAAVRYPRGAGAGRQPEAVLDELPWGKGEIRRESGLPPGTGKRIALLAFGTLLYPALEAAGKLDATVANMRFAKPLDTALVAELARTHDALVTVEEGCLPGGAGSAVGEFLHTAGLATPLLSLGLPDHFIEHGDPVKLLALQGLDAAGIEQSVRQRFGKPLSLVADRRPAA